MATERKMTLSVSQRCRNRYALLLALTLFFATPAWSQLPDCAYLPATSGIQLPAQGPLAKVFSRRNDSAPKVILQPQGTWRALVVLVDFEDYPWFTSEPEFFNYPDSLFTPQYFEQMLFSLDRFRDPLSQASYTGSMRDFYRAASFGKFDLTGVVTEWVRADHPMKYYVNADGRPGTSDDFGYGAYPQNAQGLVTEILQKLDDRIDFRQFDNTGDGAVDALFIVHAGPAAEEFYTENPAAAADFFWSHAWKIPPLMLDGVEFSRYTLEPENGTIGVFCHEFGHAFGLPDLYDPDNSSEGIGEWGLMGAGGWCHRRGDRLGTHPSQFCAWSKYKLGWLAPIFVDTGEAFFTLASASLHNAAVLLRSPRMPEGEYFLLENRQPVGFDAGLTRRQKDFDLPDPAGLLILHVDERRGDQSNELRRLLDVEEATPYFSPDSSMPFEQLDATRQLPAYRFLRNGNRGDEGDLFPGFARTAEDLVHFEGPRLRRRFDDFSIPAAHANSGIPSGVAVENIEQLPDGRVSFGVRVEVATAIQPPRNADAVALPQKVALSPNPVRRNQSMRLVGLIPGRPVQFAVFDLLGRMLLRQELAVPADGSVELNLLQTSPFPLLPSGIYFLRVQQHGAILRKKLILLP